MSTPLYPHDLSLTTDNNYLTTIDGFDLYTGVEAGVDFKYVWYVGENVNGGVTLDGADHRLRERGPNALAFAMNYLALTA